MPEMIPDYYYRKRGHIMGFTKKTWKNRIAEYINRRLLTMEDGSTNLVTVARDEGTISQEGDAFNAANMNDLEDRIAAEFEEINQSLAWKYLGSITGINNIYIALPECNELLFYVFIPNEQYSLVKQIQRFCISDALERTITAEFFIGDNVLQPTNSRYGLACDIVARIIDNKIQVTIGECELYKGDTILQNISTSTLNVYYR